MLPLAPATANATFAWIVGPGGISLGSPSSPSPILAPVDMIAAAGSTLLGSDGQVYSLDSAGAVTLIPGLANIVRVTSGTTQYALDSDGNLWGWGDDSRGQLARDPSGTQDTPIIINTNVVDVSSLGSWVIVIKDDGSVESVGYNATGALGNGKSADLLGADYFPYIETTWQSVTPGGATPIQTAVNTSTSFLVMDDGSCLGTGFNSGNWLGTGDAETFGVWMPMLFSDAIALCVGGNVASYYTLKADGSIWSYGNNSFGQLGQGPDVPLDGSGRGARAYVIGTSNDVASPAQWIAPTTETVPVSVSKPGIPRLSSEAFYVVGNDGSLYGVGATLDFAAGSPILPNGGTPYRLPSLPTT
jgi:alpha-tubulin suppressor-like RCC1 family protein